MLETAYRIVSRPQNFLQVSIEVKYEKNNDFINWFLLGGKLVGKNSLGNLKCNAVTFVYFQIFGIIFFYFRQSLLEFLCLLPWQII